MTKIDFINKAYSRARISGLTSQPTPADLVLALDRLENMAALWKDSNICTGYAFEDAPDVNTLHNVPREYWNAYESNLAVLLLSDFGKQAHPFLVAEAQGTFSRLSASTARPSQIDYPHRQPIGSGNSNRYNRWQRFYRKIESAPNECATNLMIKGDIDDFTEHYDSWLLATETVSSYTIASDNTTNLVVSGDSLTSPDISYRVQAVDSGAYVVTIVATSSLGRVLSRKINFLVSE